MGGKALLFVLVLVGLIFACYVIAQTFDAPTVDEGISKLEILETGGTGGTEIVPVVIGTNESNETNKTKELDELLEKWWRVQNPVVARNLSTNKEYGIPKWWYWSKEDFEKLQRYANQTEIQWGKDYTGMTYGKIVVAGEPLYKGYACKECPNYGFTENVSPVAYLNGQRKGNCHTVPGVYFYLRKSKGENVKFVGAANIDYNLDVEGGFHYWTEWTDSEDNEWVGNFDKVFPKEYWYQRYNWTVDWAQFDEPPMMFHGQINRWTTKTGERKVVQSGGLFVSEVFDDEETANRFYQEVFYQQ